MLLRENCPYSEFSWSVFSRIWTRKTPNTDTFYAVCIIATISLTGICCISFAFLCFYLFCTSNFLFNILITFFYILSINQLHNNIKKMKITIAMYNFPVLCAWWKKICIYVKEEIVNIYKLNLIKKQFLKSYVTYWESFYRGGPSNLSFAKIVRFCRMFLNM